MDSSRAEEKRKLDEDEEDEEEDDYDDESGGTGDADKRRRMMRMPSSPGKRRSSTATGSGSSGWGSASCQAENCSANMAEEKRYHRRHKVCEHHAKATVAVVAGIQQRFCQQCSRFHELGEFDQAKRSCRRRLSGHNERRRKSSNDFPVEGSS